LARIVNYSNEVHIDKIKEVIPDELQNVHQGTSLLLKNYIDQVLNGVINYYNSVLTTTYNRIVTLETEVTYLWEELTRLPRGNITSKTKIPKPPTFVGSKNKMHLHDWLS